MHYWLAGESSAAIDIYGAAIYYQLLSKFTLCYALPADHTHLCKCADMRLTFNMAKLPDLPGEPVVPFLKENVQSEDSYF